MSLPNVEKYSLLRNSEDSGEGDSVDSVAENAETAGSMYQRPSKSSWTRIWKGWVPNIILLMSITTNLVIGIILASMIRRPSSVTGYVTQEAKNLGEGSSTYAQLSPDPSFRFPYSTGYGPEITNHTLADIRWESIDINPGIVAVDNSWASSHNLVNTQPFPWDETKGVYTISAFHTLHCLRYFHRIIYDAHHQRPLSRDVGHAMHCIDHMRKEAMCNADDYLLPTPPGKFGLNGPRGQSRVCKNWDALVAWADQHNACYQHITDDEEGFAVDHKEIERYANCPPDSPYRQKMAQYFEEKGMDLNKVVVKRAEEYFELP